MINPMANNRDRILLVENDAVVSDLIGRQTLQAAGYQVSVASDAGTAIAKALQWSPDLVIANLSLPGLSGKDLMVALTSQGVQVPVIVLAQCGLEADIMQTFRLGAADYLLLPVREAEVIAAVERVLRQGRDRRERDRLAQQLQQTNNELQARVRELTTIFAVGKTLTSTTDQTKLLDKVLEAAVRVTQADLGWFMLREDTTKPFLVAAERNLPSSMGVRVNQTWDDGISSLVAMSGEMLSIHGDPLKRFKIYALGMSALIVPVKAQQKKVIGLLAMMRRQAVPFGSSEQHLLEALADYTSISLVNARMFRVLEERARWQQQEAETARKGGKINFEILEIAKRELMSPLSTAFSALDRLVKDPTAHWRQEQRQQLSTLQDQLTVMNQVVLSLSAQSEFKSNPEKTRIALGNIVREVARNMQFYAQQIGISVITELTAEPLIVMVNSEQITQALDSVISSLVRFSNRGAMISVRMVAQAGSAAHLMVNSSNLSVDAADLVKMFDQPIAAASGGKGAGVSIRLNLMKEIINEEGGKAWIETVTMKNVVFHITLPLVR